MKLYMIRSIRRGYSIIGVLPYPHYRRKTTR